MPWVVDTCVLIDVADADPQFADASARLLDDTRPLGLSIAPVTYAEMAPVFGGDTTRQETFLFHLQINWREDWLLADTRAAHAAWHRHIQARRRERAPKRPLADILIGAFAQRFDGLITRNTADFRRLFPALPLLCP